MVDFLTTIVRATKTVPEREDEEADRLVRPAPKDKPPRRDRRREQVQVDDDPDKEKDPDTSKNYKDIGGSVVRRWAKKKLIRVRDRKTGEPVNVSPKTLKEKSDQYEEIKPEEKPSVEEAVKPETEAAPDTSAEGQVEPKKTKKQKKKEKKEEKAKAKAEAEAKAKAEAEAKAKADKELAAKVVSKWIEERQHKSPAFQSFLDAIPTGDVDPASGEVLVLDPKTKKRVPFDQLDMGAQKALIDEFSARKEKADKEKAQGKEALKKRKQSAELIAKQDPEVREALMTLSDPNSEASQKAKELAKSYKLKDIRLEKLFPQLKGKLPEGMDSIAVAQDVVKSASEYSALPVAEKLGVKDPPRREVSEDEQAKTLTYLMDNLPPEMATALFGRGIHPDDARDLVDHYREARDDLKEASKDPVAYAQQMSEVYTDDPDQVKPPKEWNGKPFHRLSDKEKSEALRAQQMKVLAISAAAKENLAQTFSRRGAPPVLASTLAGGMLLQKADSSEAAKAKQAQKMASMVFDTMMTQGQHIPMSDRAVRGVMKGLDPHTQEIARAFFQANDYHAAKDKYLRGGEYEGLSEFGSARSILKGLRKATQYMDDRAKAYGGGNVARQLFTTRVMDRLRVLSPEKYEVVQRRVDKQESDDYDKAHQEWEREHKAWLERKKKHEEKLPFGGAAPQLKGKSFEEPEPEEPVKPVRYGAHRKPSKKKKDSLWESVFGRSKTASRVADRYHYTISIYPGGLAMAQRSDKEALYHGVEPDKVEPYPDWQPAHQRDLGEADFRLILNTAKKWLQTPVLSQQIEGAVPDQRFRAALDYAIQTGRYNRAINPNLYNMLLARLAGIPEPGPGQTLQTIQGSTCRTPASRRSDMAVKTAQQSKYASEILTRIDKLAKDIQEHHDKWGMSMQEAKAVVNHLDLVADDFEKAAFGEESFLKRQREVMAKVLQRDPDESFMDNYNNIHQPEQTDADEPYMSAYNDDQSSAVETGREENGEPLAP